MLPRGCASVLGLDMLVTSGLYDLDVSVGHMLYVLHDVSHMLCVVVLCLVQIGVHYLLCFQPKCAFGFRPCFALCLDILVVGMLFFFQRLLQPRLCAVLCSLHRSVHCQYAVCLHECTVVCLRYICSLPSGSCCLRTVSVRGTPSARLYTLPGCAYE